MKVYKQFAIKDSTASSGQPSDSEGQLLIEVLISSLVLLIITSGIVASVIVGVRNAAYARQRTLATYYAQREMELAKQEIKNNWNFPGVSGNLTQYPVSAVIFDGIDGVTLTVGCFLDPAQANPNNCNPPVVSLRATALWNRAGLGTQSQVILSTIIIKDNR